MRRIGGLLVIGGVVLGAGACAPTFQLQPGYYGMSSQCYQVQQRAPRVNVHAAQQRVAGIQARFSPGYSFYSKAPAAYRSSATWKQLANTGC